MKIYNELFDLKNYETTDAGKSCLQKLIDNDLDEEFITELNALYPDGLSETALDDLLGYDEAWCLHLVGLKTDEEKEEYERDCEDNGFVLLQVPCWALNYIVNGDAEGLESDELETVKSFCEKYEFGSVYQLPDEDAREEYFCDSPEFGPACNVCDCWCKEVKAEDAE